MPHIQDASGPLALVVALHGGLGSGDQLADTSQFEPLAERDGFAVVFPDGVSATWNAGSCCGAAVTRKIDDVAFLVALVDDIAKKVPIDRGRVFAVGHSNGAMMAFRLGCEASPTCGIARSPYRWNRACTPRTRCPIGSPASRRNIPRRGRGSVDYERLVPVVAALSKWTAR